MKKILILLFITNSLFAQVQFEAKVSKNSLGLNERLRVDFTMNADGDNFVPPSFEQSGFKVVGVMKSVGVKFDKLLDVTMLQKLL
jgi:hypothetical protein